MIRLFLKNLSIVASVTDSKISKTIYLIKVLEVLLGERPC